MPFLEIWCTEKRQADRPGSFLPSSSSLHPQPPTPPGTNLTVLHGIAALIHSVGMQMLPYMYMHNANNIKGLQCVRYTSTAEGIWEHVQVEIERLVVEDNSPYLQLANEVWWYILHTLNTQIGNNQSKATQKSIPVHRL